MQRDISKQQCPGLIAWSLRFAESLIGARVWLLTLHEHSSEGAGLLENDGCRERKICVSNWNNQPFMMGYCRLIRILSPEITAEAR
jgi:hypothetical protein